MRKIKALLLDAFSPPVCDEIETWIGVLLALAAALLLYATLASQAAP
jgi:hypothetical protein